MTASQLASESAGLLRTLAPGLLIAGLVIFIPFGFLDAIAEIEIEEGAAGVELVVAAAGALGALFLSLLGEVLYTGIVSAMVRARHEGVTHSWRAALTDLPVARLIVADALYVVAVLAGTLLLIVPGVLILVRYALIAPAIEIEDRRVMAAFRRSATVVRGRFALVGSIVLPLTIGSEVLSEFVFSEAIDLLGDSLLGEWLGAVLAELIAAPLLAVFVVVAFLRLRPNVE